MKVIIKKLALLAGSLFFLSSVQAAEIAVTTFYSKSGGIIGPLNKTTDKINGRELCQNNPTAGCDFDDNTGFDIGAVLAGLGIGGLALAMAAKDLVSNVFGGITIFTDKPFKIKDRIKIGGFDGIVEEIGIRSTKIRTLEGRVVTVPNAKFTDSMVENVSVEPSRKVVLNLGLIYDTKPDQMQLAMDTLREIVSSHNSTEETIHLAFNKFGDSSLGILLIYYIRKGEDILKTQTDINLAIISRFTENKLEFAYPTQTILTQQIN